ncbi:MAG TPA: hypothetical protein VI837_14215, partial [Blastocatellia bacterium]|nr:hypothetical protein [Blastocatellia bacterium]
MRRLTRYTTFFVLTLGLLSAGAQSIPLEGAFALPITARASSDALSLKDRVEVFEEVWETIDGKYYDASFNGVDWRAVRDRYRPLVEQ